MNNLDFLSIVKFSIMEGSEVVGENTENLLKEAQMTCLLQK